MKYKMSIGNTAYWKSNEYENDYMLPVIRKAQTLMQININNRKQTPEIIVWNTDTEKPVARIWNDNGEVCTQIL